MRFVIPFVLFLALTSGVACAIIRPGNQLSGTEQPSQPATGQNDLRALRSDLQRMRALVQQMESNLTFVDTTQSPLKHQFELEIDMWKTVIGEMERKINAAGAR